MTSPTASDAGTWLPTLCTLALTRNRHDTTCHEDCHHRSRQRRDGLPDLLHQIPEVEIVGITDKDPRLPAFSAHGTSMLVEPHVSDLIQNEQVGLIMDVTGDPSMNAMIQAMKRPDAEVLSGAARDCSGNSFSINQHLRPNCSRPTNWPVWDRLRPASHTTSTAPAVDSRPCGKSRG